MGKDLPFGGVEERDRGGEDWFVSGNIACRIYDDDDFMCFYVL